MRMISNFKKVERIKMMRILNCLEFLLILVCLTLANDSQRIFQNSFYHGKISKDSVVLSGTPDPEVPYWNKAEVYRQGKLILQYSDKELELEGSPGHIFTEGRSGKDYVYILTINERPLPPRFLILKATKDSVGILGITGNTTAVIFGDVDKDGIFEIGGYLTSIVTKYQLLS